MLIRSSEDALGEPSPNALENAAPGQVLLSSAIAESVNQLPNVVLRGTGHDGLVEMQWRSFETELSSVADEQSVLRLIRELGREDPVEPELQAPTSTSAQTSQTPTSTMATGSFSTGRAHVEDDSALAGRKKKWLMIGGAAAAVVLAGILIMVLGHHAATPPAASPNATTRQVEQATPAGGTAASAPDTSDKAESTKSAEQKSSRTAEKASKAKAETAQTAALGSCDLTEGEIPRSLARAESYLHDGRLSDAQDVYKHLAGCPSARQRAVEGLQLVKQRIAAGSSAQ
jgi:hypothetical protein